MSRIGKRPLPVPAGVTVKIDGSRVNVKGPKGELSRLIHEELKVRMDGTQLLVERPTDEAKHKALHGLSRALLKNMIEGVSQGYAKTLEIQGVGYKAEARPPGVRLTVGFSHPVDFKAPAGIKLSVENNVLVKIEGPDKELVGLVYGCTEIPSEGHLPWWQRPVFWGAVVIVAFVILQIIFW